MGTMSNERSAEFETLRASLRLNATDKKILLAAGAVFLLLIMLAALLVKPMGEDNTPPTTYSAGSRGAKAAYLLLGEMGRDVERYRHSPVELDDFLNTTLIIADPSEHPTPAEREALERFVREGGRLIATGPNAAWVLPENNIRPNVTISDIPPDWEEFSALAASDITLAAPKITMSPRAFWASPDSAFALYGTKAAPVVVRYPYGEGTILWWADAAPLTNAGITESGNLEFFISCLGEKENRILWDEYFHGYRQSTKGAPGLAALLIGFMIQSALLVITAIWTFSRRSGPLRPQFEESRLSPLEFTETLGNLYHRARAASVAVDICRQRFIYLLSGRLGISPNDTPERIEQSARERWGECASGLATVLKECAEAKHNNNMPAKQALDLVRSLYKYTSRLKRINKFYEK